MGNRQKHPELPADLERAVLDVLEQRTARNLFLFGQETNSFQDRFGEWYERIRKRWLHSTKEAMRSEKIKEDAESQMKLRRYKSELLQLGFEACRTDEVTRHNDGEVRVKGETNVRQRYVDVVHFVGRDPNASLIELLLICDMLNRSGAKEINVYAPYLPYQREDKKDEGRVPIAARLVFDLIEAAAKKDLGRIVTVDLHSSQAQGFTSGPLDHLSATPILARYLISQEFHDKFGVELKDITIVAPDVGAAKRAKKLAGLLGVQYIVFDGKARPEIGDVEYDASRVNQIKTPYGIWVDDMIDTGGTLVESVEAARKQFALKGVFALATHGLFSPKKDKKTGKILYYAEDKLRASGIKVIVTDTIPRHDPYYEQNKDWLVEVISIAEPLANLALNNRLGYSVSTYMEKLENKVKEAVKAGRRLDMKDYLLRSLKPAPERPPTAAAAPANGTAAPYAHEPAFKK